MVLQIGEHHPSRTGGAVEWGQATKSQSVHATDPATSEERLGVKMGLAQLFSEARPSLLSLTASVLVSHPGGKLQIYSAGVEQQDS